MSAEPQIQYALTADGISIGYWTLGQGKPLVLPSGGAGVPSLRAWRTAEGREFIERLAANRMIVRYDARGAGSSQGGTVDFSLEARVADLSAVVEKLGVDEINLCGYLDSGPTTIAYVAANPGRVSRLILWGCSLHETKYVSDEVLRLLLELAELDFELYREALLAAVVRQLGRDERAYEFAQSLRENMTSPVALSPRIDVSGDLAKVSAPTLVLHRRGMKTPPMAEVQTIAAGIPDARLCLLEGESSSPYVGDTDAVVAAIDEFLGDAGAPVDRASQRPAHSLHAGSLRTVLFTDLVGHTEMMQRLGDAKGREVLREHERITRDLLNQHGGAEVKTMGDGFLASFGSVTAAMECAIALQRAFASHTESMPEPLHVRVGLNAGEPIEEDGDLFGSTVIMASRIAAKAGAGEILIPEPLRHLLTGKSYVYADRGETMLKGFEDAVRLYEVRWQE